MRRAALFTLLLASSAHAAPIATASEDLDGDGAKDTLALAGDGTLTLGARGTVKLGAVGRAARIEVARHRDGTVYVLVVAGTQAYVIKGGATWREVARFPVGGVGLDADYSVDATAIPDEGVLRFQTRPGIRRCDGKPALAFAEGWNGTKFVRRSALPALVGTATVLPAKLDTAPAMPVLFGARVASHQIGAGDAGGLGIPTELDDGSLQTAWREELAISSGEGQWFTYVPRVAGLGAKQLRIVPGSPASAQAMKQVNRPKTLAIVGAGVAYRVVLPDAARDPLGSAYVVELPVAIEGCVTVVLEDTYGPDRGQTAIAEMSVFADGERTGGADAMLARVVAEGKDGAKAAGDVLARRGATGATALEAEIVKTSKADVRRRLVAVLARNHDPAAVPSLVRAATEGWVDDKALVAVVEALGRIGVTDELAQLAASESLPIDARIAAARALGTDAKGFPLLVDLAGTGPHALRKVVIDRLTTAPIDQLLAAAQKETEDASAGDLWRAITRRARHTAAEQPVALAAMTAALPGATTYERRYRLIDGIATIGDAAALRALEATLRALPADATGAALRQVAVAGAATAPRADALALVVGLAKDRDPGVRLAVLRALATVEEDAPSAWHAADPDGIDRVIAAALATDTWPDVRRRAATSLGLRCQRPGPRAALVDAVVTVKEDPEVRRDALIALVHCRAQGAADLLAKIWDDGNAPIELRTQAVSLAITLGDATLGKTLVGRFRVWNAHSMQNEAALALAQAAAPAIALLAAPGAVEALIEALDNEAFPEIVSAAATALGQLGPTCPARAKAKLEAIGKSESQAARPASLAASRCGAKAR